MFVDQLLILLASLGFATLDLLRKLLARGMDLVPLLFVLTAGVIPAYGLWFLLDGAPAPSPGYWAPALTSIALNMLANLLYLRAIHLGEFSRTIPLLALTPVFTALVAVPLLGEVPSAVQGVGIACVVVGALWLQGRDGSSSGRAGTLMPESAWLMLGVAVLWSSTSPLDKLAMRHGAVSLHALVLHLGIAGALFVWLLARRELGQIGTVRSSPWLMCGALVASGVALGAQLLALERVFAALLETLKRGWGGLAALVFGWLIFDEHPSPRKTLAIVLMIAGVALLLLL